jgi:hypothetical protein
MVKLKKKKVSSKSSHVLPKGDKRGSFELDTLAWWVIGIAVLIVVVLGLFILKGKGVDTMNYLKNIFRFGA